MPTLHDRTIAVLDGEDAKDGVIVCQVQDGKVRKLADRPPARDGHASLIVLDSPPGGPSFYPSKSPKLMADARTASRGETTLPEVPQKGSGRSPPRPRVPDPPAVDTPVGGSEGGRPGVTVI